MQTNFMGAALPLTEAGVDGFTGATGTGGNELWSVLSVETSGCGFLPDRRPKILFERHKFHALTGGQYDGSHPDISAPSAGGYGAGGANQYNRLAEAVALDRQAALKSASWGLGQVMGLNYTSAGFADVEAMVAAMVVSEDNQLAAMASFLQATGLAGPLAAHEWTSFAQGYNGANYAANNYDGQLQQFYGHYLNGSLPDLGIRAVQIRLTYAGLDPRGIDGVLGKGTRAAIKAFQAQHGLEQTGDIDEALLASLPS